MRINQPRRMVNLEKAAKDANASRAVATITGPPIPVLMSIGNSEHIRFEHEMKAIQRLCKVFGLDYSALKAEVLDWMITTDASGRSAVSWARAQVFAKPERLRL